MMKMEWQGLLIRQRNRKSLMQGWAHNKRQRNERWKVWLGKMKVIKIVNKIKCECMLLLWKNFCSITGRILLLRWFLMFFLLSFVFGSDCRDMLDISWFVELRLKFNVSFYDRFVVLPTLVVAIVCLDFTIPTILQFFVFFCLNFTQILCNCAANCLSICSTAEPARCFPLFISLCAYTYMYVCVCVRLPCIVLPFRQ